MAVHAMDLQVGIATRIIAAGTIESLHSVSLFDVAFFIF